MESEEFLLKKMQKGDWNAFEYFFKMYVQPLYVYALAFVKERGEAEDIVQNAFIYFWEHRNKIEWKSSIYAYLLRIVKNACINYKTHQQVEEKYRKDISFKENLEEEYYDWEELRNRIMTAIDSLPEKCREIFIMACIENLKYTDISNKLNVSVNTVKTQIKIAYRKIRNESGFNKLQIMAIIQFYSLNRILSKPQHINN